MRKFILIAAMVLASATAQAGASRGLTLASNDEPAAAEQPKAVEAPKGCRNRQTPAETPKYVERPSAVEPTTEATERPNPSPPRRRRRTSRSTGAIGPNRASSANCIATASIGKTLPHWLEHWPIRLVAGPGPCIT